MTNSALNLYRDYFQRRDFERLDLFKILADKFEIQRVLYPGSFVHITPSFIFPEVVYVDNDKQARKFFAKPEVYEFIAERKVYPQAAQVRYHPNDYRTGFDELDASFDLLISQYAGFVGQHCKRYLKKNGLLLANNSHGDAGIAALDEDYQVSAVFTLRNGKFRMKMTDLGEYFVPKSSKQITKEYLVNLQKGIGYKKTASVYLFQKVK